jgi:hypothetical protein
MILGTYVIGLLKEWDNKKLQGYFNKKVLQPFKAVRIQQVTMDLQVTDSNLKS